MKKILATALVALAATSAVAQEKVGFVFTGPSEEKSSLSYVNTSQVSIYNNVGAFVDGSKRKYPTEFSLNVFSETRTLQLREGEHYKWKKDDDGLARVQYGARWVDQLVVKPGTRGVVWVCPMNTAYLDLETSERKVAERRIFDCAKITFSGFEDASWLEEEKKLVEK
jgi:hypothetical protein